MGKFADFFGKAGKPVGNSAAEDDDMAKRFPNVTLLMTALVGDDGKSRQTCTLTVVCEQGMWKGGLKERDHQMSLWRSSETFTGLLEALDEVLENGTAEWKKADVSGGRRR